MEENKYNLEQGTKLANENRGVPDDVEKRKQCFCERVLETTKDGKCLYGCFYNDK